MKLSDLAKRLDDEFCIIKNDENLTDFAVVDDNKHFINNDFIKHKTALMTENSKDIEIVLTSKISQDSLRHRGGHNIIKTGLH